MKESIKKTTRFAISKAKFVLMFVGLLILVLLIRKVGLNESIRIIKGMNPAYLIVALIPWVLTLVFGAYRLKRLVKADIGFYEMFRIYCYGYLLNYASPIQGFGAGAKIAMLRMKKVKISKSSASVGSEIAYDLIFTAVIVLIFFAYHFQFVYEQLKKVLNAELAVFGAAVIIAVLTAVFLLRKRVFFREFFEHMFDSFRIKDMLHLMPVTALLWILPSIVIYMFFIAAGSPISFWIVLGSISIGFIFGLATFVPGGLGVRDAITAYIYSVSGASINTTISIAIFNRVYTMATVLLIVVLIKVFDFCRKE